MAEEGKEEIKEEIKEKENKKTKKKNRKKEKSFKKIKRNRSWVSILVFLIALLIIGVLGYAFVEVFFQYAVETKATAEYNTIKYMARVYDTYGDEEETYSLLNKEGRDYFIKDKDGNIIYQNGENTASKEGEVVYLDDDFKGVTAYTDINTSYITISDGSLEFKYKDLIKNIEYDENEGFHVGDKVIDNAKIKEYNDRLDELDKYDGEPGSVVYENGNVKVNIDYYDENVSSLNEIVTTDIPLWLSVDLSDGNTLVAKATVKINIKDIALFGVLLVVVLVVVVIVFFIVVGNVIGGFIRQRRITNFFFTDQVTKGHNWMWFKEKGGQLLRKKRNAKNKYAIVNLVFVKYRTFCMCHSIEEGEEKLCKIHDWALASLEKKELIAHATNSNFALLLKYTDADELDERIKKLIKELEQIDTEHKFAFQVGVNKIDASKASDGRFVKRKNIDVEKEYNNACTARAEFEGSEDSGIAYFDDKLVEEQKWIDMVSEKQQQALDNEEFMVYYQPKYDPRTNELRGAEALIRWQSPEYGFVSPGRIIPIFEKNGFITEIDHYMISHVARDQKAWLDKGYKCVPVSVNVSRAHFIESDLAEQIRDMVDKEGAPHELVEIELTESAFFDDKNAMINTIEKLKSYGFAVSMDDFGSGYSSLNSLKDMPLDVLKLDAEFFRGENSGERGKIVVTEAIKLAKSLNMRTVAEGVEIKEQVDFLADQDCDMIQGYYFAKPMPKDEYESRMKS
ncbi:MAG: EAL domain-containing protein [Lachnospiraceae bacterium]|nr:EAL domain-containing protein [Lachnospiraceae bacterium]